MKQVRNKWATQGACVTVALMKRPLTYMEMLALGLSTSPWRRVLEYIDRMPGLVLIKGSKKVNGRWLTTWRVVKSVPAKPAT